MVIFEQANDASRVSFTLRPNCSMGWPGMKRGFFFLFGCLCLVSLYFGSKGAWLVLPFTGLEALVLAVAVYLHSRAAGRCERIVITEGEVVVLSGGARLRQVARMPRYWARVTLIRDPTQWYPSRLLVGSHGRFIEIGRALVEAERAELATNLQGLVLPRPLAAATAAADWDPDLSTARQQIQARVRHGIQ